ncbi:hypothetical protein [Cyanobium sp. ATX 6F1]|uniref:hypothetical protein n=1 Tax=unclassified Cyanobium TaxID=2627006 RepID=UPI0020CE6C20|nr:hypothetical protein [Cyanobium sp. ATX 6F1]MCP9916260.1 hypothetical protein [Cyanobium sp. ATX 6F1]
MRQLMKVRFENAAANVALADSQFGEKMQRLLTDIHAEAAYFTAIDGQRGAYIILDLENAAQIPAVAEPFFHWLKAEISFEPVMIPADLAQAGPAIAEAARAWG